MVVHKKLKTSNAPENSRTPTRGSLSQLSFPFNTALASLSSQRLLHAGLKGYGTEARKDHKRNLCIHRQRT